MRWRRTRGACALWVSLCAGCAAHAANAGSQPASSDGARSVAARDASGDLILHGGPSASRVDDPRWLAGLQRNDLLIFNVVVGEAQALTVQYRLTRFERRGDAVAALFQPSAAPDYPGTLQPYWLAGNDEALWRLDRHPQLLEPGFTPLTADGRVVLDPRQGAVLWWSRDWADATPDQRTPDAGWVVEELSMTLEGPVRGDRCARLSREQNHEAVVVCGDVGVVQFDRASGSPVAEHWQLVEIRR